jgi:glycosyltransferase involved in cell wall biosynthesis
MRILFVAMADSIHTARWINQTADEGWDIHLFPSTDAAINPSLRNVTVHDEMIRYSGIDLSVSQAGAWSWPFPSIEKWVGLTLKRLRRSPPLAPYVKDRSRAKRLARLIRQLRPDIVHSLEIQHAGYLTLDAKNALNRFPHWIVTNWGSDIYYFGHFQEHKDRIRAVLSACDYYNCECYRDVALGKTFGFQGRVLPVLPNTGGFDLARVGHFRQTGCVSSRRIILIKGYQNWAGRALVALQAVLLCSDHLREYRVVIYSANDEVKKTAKSMSKNTGIAIEIAPPCSHDEMLHLYGSARAYIGLSISDAISTSLLESIVMGAFPIQSCTACADEWIVDGKTGFIVPPEDPEAVAAAIRRAVTDDALVDNAARINADLARERLDYSIIRRQVISMYKEIWNTTHQKENMTHADR